MSTTVCVKCGTEFQTNQMVCMKCGALLFDPSISTVHLRIDPNLLRLRRNQDQVDKSGGPERVVTLHIRGLVEKLIFEEGTEIVLGRLDLKNPTGTRFDLTPFGAHERGVSREHALLRFADGKLTITDLNTVNGTSVNTQRLNPNKPHEMHNNDEVMLGRLSLVVRFEPAVETMKLPIIPEDMTKPILTVNVAGGDEDTFRGPPVSAANDGSGEPKKTEPLPPETASKQTGEGKMP
jgi:hypothetical protein